MILIPLSSRRYNLCLSQKLAYKLLFPRIENSVRLLYYKVVFLPQILKCLLTLNNTLNFLELFYICNQYDHENSSFID